MNSPIFFFRLAPAVLLLQGLIAQTTSSNERGGRQSSPWVALARGRVEPPGGIVQIAANRDGRVKDILVQEGDTVAKGTALATLDDEAAQLRLAVAQQELTQTHAAMGPLQVRKIAAEREVHRLDQLVARQLANAQDLDQARDRVAEVAAEISQEAMAENTARAQLALAQYEVDARVIRAPVTGCIIRRLVSLGEGTSTEPVTPLFWLAPDGPRVVRAQLDEDSVHLVAPGQLAEVVIESATSRVLKARVQKVGLFFGPRRPSTDDPAERQDMRVVDCVLVLEEATPSPLIGQRVLVRFLGPGKSAR